MGIQYFNVVIGLPQDRLFELVVNNSLHNYIDILQPWTILLEKKLKD